MGDAANKIETLLYDDDPYLSIRVTIWGPNHARLYEDWFDDTSSDDQREKLRAACATHGVEYPWP